MSLKVSSNNFVEIVRSMRVTKNGSWNMDKIKPHTKSYGCTDDRQA